jgi:hypothetical protein
VKGWSEIGLSVIFDQLWSQIVLDPVSKWPRSLWQSWSWYMGEQLWCSRIGSSLHENRRKMPLNLVCQAKQRSHSEWTDNWRRSFSSPVCCAPWSALSAMIRARLRMASTRWAKRSMGELKDPLGWIGALPAVPTGWQRGRAAVTMVAVGFLCCATPGTNSPRHRNRVDGKLPLRELLHCYTPRSLEQQKILTPRSSISSQICGTGDWSL